MNQPSPDPTLLIGPDEMEDIRADISETRDDVIAVLVLRGSPERGLAVSCSSATTESETVGLLAAAIPELLS